MCRIGLMLLLLLGLAGCQLTREPKPVRPPEVLQMPPDEARYQAASKIYPTNVLNQDTNARSREVENKNPLMRRGMGGSTGGGGMPGGY